VRACAVCAVVLIAVAVAACGGSDSGAGSETPTPSATASASGGGPDAQALFTANGCGGCHTLAKAGTSGTTGPDLDQQLAADAKAAGMPLNDFIRQSIVKPSAYVAKGYPDGVMPQDFGDKLTPEQLDALVAYLGSSGR
jgi:cytochrome c oxidase subunit II